MLLSSKGPRKRADIGREVYMQETAVAIPEILMKKTPTVRIHSTSHPLVYEVNSRVLLHELSSGKSERTTLGNIPDSVLDRWASLGFDAIWMMGVWTTGKSSVEIARTDASLQQEFKRVLPDLTEDDIIGSPYAIRAYNVPPALGGNKGLLALRKKLRERGLGLILDFVPNHTARDHHWVTRHPEYYVQSPDQHEAEGYFAVPTVKGTAVLAHGRDPNFPGWTDTAQLNVRLPDTRRTLLETLKKIASMCDGVRCDMAMLLLSDVFEKTWGERSLLPGTAPAVGEFWGEMIRGVKAMSPDFKFIAEAYWDREWQLQQLGFDYTYDKRLYERLSHEGAASVYDHLKADPEYQRKSVRFIENHDEQRAARAFSSEAWHFAAATVMATVPGMALFHEGQLSGRKTKLPVQLARRPPNETSPQVESFYTKLLSVVSHSVFREGEWRLLHAKPAWYDNHSWSNFLIFLWTAGSRARMVVVNYAPLPGQCYVELALDDIKGTAIEFKDLMGTASYVRERSALTSKGMYFDLPGYSLHIFELCSHKPAHPI